MESIKNLQRDLEVLKQECRLRCFLVYGSLLQGVERPNDLDVIIVVDAFEKTQAIFEAISKHFPESKLDFHIYLTEEVETGVSFFTREYVLEYLSKGMCLCGENLFKDKFEQVTLLQYKKSMFIRSVEHVQMVRKTLFSDTLSKERKLIFVRKYLLRLSINVLLFNNISSHEALSSMTLLEVLRLMKEFHFLTDFDEKLLTEGSWEEVFNLFSTVSARLPSFLKEIS